MGVRVSRLPMFASAGCIACWSFVSSGLMRAGHREVVLTLRREPDEVELPVAVVGSYFASLLAFAEQGSMVQEWGISAFDEAPFWGRRGVIYAPALNLSLELPTDVLAAIIVENDELSFAERFGPSRVMALLGLSTHYYPWPPWFDRSRKPMPVRASVLQGILSRMPVLSVTQGWVSREGRRVTINMPLPLAAKLAKALPQLPTNAVAFTFAIDPQADSCMVFTGEGAGLIATLGSLTERNALVLWAIVRDAEADELRYVEDGVLLLQRPASWVELERALIEGRPFHTTLDDIELRLRWHDDPGPMRAERWNWTPRAGQGDGGVRLLGIELDDEPQVIEQVGRELITGLVSQTQAIIVTHMRERPPSASLQLTVDVRLTPGGLEHVVEGDVGTELEQALRAAVPTRLESGEVHMRLRFEVSQGSQA
jgi:hypothetical protein